MKLKRIYNNRIKNMAEQTIRCPKCKTDIPLTEVLTAQIKEGVKNELMVEVEKKEKALAEKEKDILAEKKLIEDSRENIEEEVNKRLDVEKKKIKEQTKKDAEDEVSLELKDLQEQIQEKNKKIKESQDKELELRKKQREIEDKEKSFDLELARKLSDETKKIEENLSKRITEEQSLKLLEKEQAIEGMKKQINELKRKAELGSQQLQGEVQELDLEKFLRENFIYDEIKPVPKGVQGADALQKVITKNESFCGSILWESKRTKNWVEEWTTKLKDDQREAKADLAVIVSDVLPKEISNAGFHNGVWVTNRSSIHGLSMALRTILTQVTFTKLAAEGKDEKVELLFRYLTGSEFTQRVQAMIETFISMKQDLEKEKRSSISRWGKQEKQIEKIMTITAGMHGDLRGLIGSSMQSIPTLESGDEEENNAEPLIVNDIEDKD
jgi:hypothetical protein